ncbi:MAG: D-alanyl-D-alanine carboxypeptidase, partial [Candidatus Eremiobacteraeota bacterium]|nr:D-alanyl-D-alanine carboxypeptidase [Candidatus Eremiobacteraeota bacterium]
MRRFCLFLLCAALTATAVPVHAADMSSVNSVQRPSPGGVPWTWKQIQKLHASLAHVLKAKALAGAHVGLVVTDTVRGTPLYSLNADDEFMPASNFKLLV